MISKAQQKATSKYISKAYDQVSLRMPKGKREIYKAHAERKGKSLNALIIELLEMDIAIENIDVMENEDYFDEDVMEQG